MQTINLMLYNELKYLGREQFSSSNCLLESVVKYDIAIQT